jgi:hypothetical protein
VDRDSIWNEPIYVGWIAPLKGAGKVYRSMYVQGYDAIKAANPNAVIASISVEAGSSGPNAMWAGFAGKVDYLNVGFAGQDAVRYDFG